MIEELVEGLSTAEIGLAGLGAVLVVVCYVVVSMAVMKYLGVESFTTETQQ